MQEWKARSKAYHLMNKEYTDDLNKVEIKMTDDVVGEAVRHFNEIVDEWIYPAKSYFVAICYANWITEDFTESFYEVLDDPDLLPHDPYFKRYSEDMETYDDILWMCNWKTNKQGMVPDVRKYYEEEMLVGQL